MNFLLILQLKVLLGEESDVSYQVEEELNLSELRGPFLEFRQRYTAILITKNTNRIDGVLQIFYDLWGLLSVLDPRHPLFIPPIYQSESIHFIMRSFITELLVRESGVSSDTGNIVLGGVEGTGKTTLTKAFLLAVTVCSVTYLFIYFDCGYSQQQMISSQRHPFASHLIDELEYRLSQNDFRGEFGYLPLPKEGKSPSKTIKQIKKRYGFFIGIMLDEVQSLYIPGEKHDERIACLHSYEVYARQVECSFLLITGSSSDLHFTLFRKGELSEHCVSYPNFNKSLCSYYHVPAIRDIESLARYIHRRYHRQLTDHQLRLILYSTGGVGRLIDQLLTREQLIPLNLGVIERVKTVYKISFLFQIVGLFYQRFPDVFERMNQFWKEADRIFLLFKDLSSFPTEESAIQVVELLPERLPGLKKDEIILILHSLGVPNPANDISRLIDFGFLYLSHDRDGIDDKVEISILALLKSFSIERDSEDLILLSACLLMIFTNHEVNAGKAFEKLIRRKIHLLEGNLFGESQDNEFEITDFTCQVNSLSDVNSPPRVIDSLAGLELYTNQIMKWKNEIGLDGIQLTRDSSSKVFAIDCWQCKGGFCESAIGGGDINTYRKKYLEDGIVAKCDDSYMNGILAKGEVGMLTLLKQLSNRFPEARFNLRYFVITTTKSADQGRKLLTNHHYRFSIPNAMKERFNANLTSAELTYQVVLYSYPLVWLRKIFSLPLCMFLNEAEERYKEQGLSLKRFLFLFLLL